MEVAPDASYLEALRKERDVTFLGRNEEWGSHLVDITSAKWQDWVVTSLASAAWEKGFSGFFLDTADIAAFETRRRWKGPSKGAATT